MAWRLRGTYFESCNCDMVCPCSTSGLTMPADNERCRVVLAFHVASGEIEGVNVSNLNVAVLADTPQTMIEGNWRLGVFMDAAASPQQQLELGAVFSGQRGGPMALLAPLVGEMMGIEVVPIQYEDDGRRHRVKIGGAAEIEIEDFVPPGSPTKEVEKITGAFHPANSTLTVAKTVRSRVRAFGLEFSNDGKNGHSAPFAWAG